MGSFVRKAAVAACALPFVLRAPGAQDSHRVNGVVQRVSGDSAPPVPGAWVVLHRVARGSGGPVDSVRTDARGRYAFSYRTTGDSGVYFASVTFSGVAYFTSPFTGADVRGDDATVTVYDTVSAGAPIRTRGYHVIVFAAGANGQRNVAEVYWLENTAPVTRVSREPSPAWATTIPERATNVRIDQGDIPPNAVVIEDGRASVYAPFAPGLRQLQLSYDMPASDFPLTLTVHDSTTVLEVMVEESGARVLGARLAPQAAVTAGGRRFERFLAQDALPGTTFRIEVPRGPVSRRAVYIMALVGLAGLAVLARLARGAMRQQAARTERGATPASAVALAKQIAALDARFERRSSPTDAERAEYLAKRDALNEAITDILAERDDRL